MAIRLRKDTIMEVVGKGELQFYAFKKKKNIPKWHHVWTQNGVLEAGNGEESITLNFNLFRYRVLIAPSVNISFLS